MLKQATGNLIDLAIEGQFDVVLQGCNCWNTFGGGIAREIRLRLPEAYAADCQTIPGDIQKLGNYTSAKIMLLEHTFEVVNAYTQYDMSTGEDVFEYEAFQLILKKLLATEPDGLNWGFPLIGMGLAKGDPARILPMIEDFATQITANGGSVTLVTFNK
jgi:O-acetyl-ADP-ribose deacetylase (regulator of RNase III)